MVFRKKAFQIEKLENGVFTSKSGVFNQITQKSQNWQSNTTTGRSDAIPLDYFWYSGLFNWARAWKEDGLFLQFLQRIRTIWKGDDDDAEDDSDGDDDDHKWKVGLR